MSNWSLNLNEEDIRKNSILGSMLMLKRSWFVSFLIKFLLSVAGNRYYSCPTHVVLKVVGGDRNETSN